MTTLPDRAGSQSYLDSQIQSIVVVPIGSFEQHGAHLPLDTDTRIATAVADAAVALCSHDSVAIFRAPAIEISASDEHLGFPGTLSIGTEGLAHALVSIAASAVALSSNQSSPSSHQRPWCVGTIFVNGHGGNTDAISSAHEELARRSIAHSFWSVSGYPDNDSHAGHSETSMMLHIDATSVRMNLAEPGNSERLEVLMPTMREGGVRAVSANGVLGDPRDANAEKGAALFQRNVSALVELIEACQREWAHPRSTS